MADPERPDRVPSSDIDPAWRADPVDPDEPLPARPPEPPPPTLPPRPVEPPPPVAPLPPAEAPAAAEESPSPVEEGPATERLPAASSSSAVPIALAVALVLGGGFVWHHSAPNRAYRRAVYMLAQARRDQDPKAAAEALAALKPYVDSTGQGYAALFQAASLAGDDATAAAYADRLGKAPADSPDALLEWYENLLTYHDLAFKSKLDAIASARPAQALALADAALEHYDAAAALKPTRAKAVEGFDNGIPTAAAGHLMRIDAMHRELDAADVASLRAFQSRGKSADWRQAFEAYSDGQTADAMKDRAAAYEKASKLAPDFGEAFLELATAQLALLRVDDAVDDAQKAIAALEKNGPSAMGAKSDLLAEAHAIRGKALFERWRALNDAKSDKAAEALAAARAELDAAADLNPRNQTAIALHETLSQAQEK